MHIARRMAHVEASGIRRIFDLGADLDDPVDFSIGQPHFDVPPAVREAAIAAVRSGFSRYTVTQGLPELREKLRARLEEWYGIRPEHLFITAGAAGAILTAFLATLDPGDEVLVPDPYFVMYKHLATLTGAAPKFIDTYPTRFRLTPAALEAAIGPATRALMFNNPVNPTGVAYRADEIQALAAVARRHGLTVFSDEIYDRFTFDVPHTSFLKHYPEGSILVGGFSKTYGMPGWRVGYAAGPREVLDCMQTVQQFTYVCANAVAQKACITALDVDMRPLMDDYRRRRDRVVEALRGVYELEAPGGTFYAFPRVPAGSRWPTGQDFSRAAVERKLLVVPGNACSTKDTHFRISFAVPEEKLGAGLELLRTMAREGV